MGAPVDVVLIADPNAERRQPLVEYWEDVGSFTVVAESFEEAETILRGQIDRLEIETNTGTIRLVLASHDLPSNGSSHQGKCAADLWAHALALRIPAVIVDRYSYEQLELKGERRLNALLQLECAAISRSIDPIKGRRMRRHERLRHIGAY